MNRKTFITSSGMAAAAIAMAPVNELLASGTKDKIRMGIIGVGLRGQNHLDLLLRRSDVDLVAICDIDDRMLTLSKKMIEKSQKKMPDIFTGNQYAWKTMLEKTKLDAILIATPWEWHKEM
ncbi:MAG TPA: glycosyl hydrolase, partial [Chitinophagaceae bacterium]|nr:glycosyl hydrolase [Chitinophagaceae bacterium]